MLSGLVGVGGGIFLSPLLLLGGWATARQTAGISAPFILVNSLAALGGIAIAGTATPIDPLALSAWAVAVLLAGWVGAGVGSRRLRHPALRRLLSIVLLAAATKMFLAPRGHDGGAADRIGATPVNPDD